MSQDAAFFFLRVGLLSALLSWAIMRHRGNRVPKPEEPEDEHLHI